MINLPDPISPICKEIFDKTEDEFKNLSSKLKINNILRNCAKTALCNICAAAAQLREYIWVRKAKI